MKVDKFDTFSQAAGHVQQRHDVDAHGQRGLPEGVA